MRIDELQALQRKLREVQKAVFDEPCAPVVEKGLFVTKNGSLVHVSSEGEQWIARVIDGGHGRNEHPGAQPGEIYIVDESGEFSGYGGAHHTFRPLFGAIGAQVVEGDEWKRAKDGGEPSKRQDFERAMDLLIFAGTVDSLRQEAIRKVRHA